MKTNNNNNWMQPLVNESEWWDMLRDLKIDTDNVLIKEEKPKITFVSLNIIKHKIQKINDKNNDSLVGK